MSARTLHPEELRWVVCPACRKPLELEGEAVKCVGCGRRYPIVEGIAVLIRERAF